MPKLFSKTINIIPDKSLMPKMGKTGYSVAQAISELVDNALDARFDDKILTVTIEINKNFIEVLDNGKGMSEKEAAKCLKLAYSKKVNELGEFGLGLKTAATSLGKRFGVFTKQKGSDKEFILKYDEDEWLKRGKWDSHPMEIRTKVSKNRSGTKVRIERLIIKYYPILITRLKEELATRYAPFIANKILRIKVRTRWCKAKPLELTSKGKDYFEFLLKDGNVIKGWRGLLLVGSNKGYYGFSTFRRGRLITQFDKIGFEPHPEVRQIVGELHLDHLPVTHNKREFIKESYAYQVMEEAMKKFMKPFIAEARKSVRSRIVDEKMVDKMNAQMEVIAKALNRIPELKVYALPTFRDKPLKVDKTSHAIAKIEVEERGDGESSLKSLFTPPESRRQRTPKLTHRRKRCILLINGKKYKFTHQFRDFQDPTFWKDKTVTEENGVEIFTNTAFPAFLVTKDQIFYATMHVAEAIAEVAVEEKRETKDKVFELRDAILRESSLIAREIDKVDQIEKETEKLEKELKRKKKQIVQLQKELGF